MRRLKNPAGAKALLLMTTSTPPISNTAFLTVKGEVVQLDSTGRQIGSLAYDKRLSLERFRVSAQTDNRCLHTLYAWQVSFNSLDLGLEKARAAVKTLARVEAFLLKAHQKDGAPADFSQYAWRAAQALDLLWARTLPNGEIEILDADSLRVYIDAALKRWAGRWTTA